VSDCEELVGPPDRRDSKPRSHIQAEIRLTNLCIERWGLVRSFLFPHYSSSSKSCILISQVYYRLSANWLTIRPVR